jgi:RNA polymerase sigma-70 factor, ECF subfamily
MMANTIILLIELLNSADQPDRPEIRSNPLNLRQLLNEYQDRVYNQAYRMLGSHEDAEEATQDVFLRIHRGLEEFRGDSKVTTWIYSITSNVCISRLRKKQHPTCSLDKPFPDSGDTLADVIPGDSPDPSEILEDEQMRALVRSEVRNLPPKWAMAISLYHFNDQSYEEIASTMGIPKATVATYILRGRQQLATQLAKAMGHAHT